MHKKWEYDPIVLITGLRPWLQRQRNWD